MSREIANNRMRMCRASSVLHHTATWRTPASSIWLGGWASGCGCIARGPNEQALDLLEDREVRLASTSRSGPIVVEIEYRVSPKKARLFYAVMQHVRLSRKRNVAAGP